MGGLGPSRGEKAVIGVRRGIKKLFGGLANQLHKNDLFEQPGERPMQEKLSKRKARDAETQLARLANLDALENELIKHRVINHWATWCEPCIEELPLLKKLSAAVGSQQILGISWDLFQGGRPEQVCAHVDSVAMAHEIDYLSLIVTSPPESFFGLFDIEEQTVPQTWVFSETFELVYQHHGILTEAEIDKIIELLNGGENG